MRPACDDREAEHHARYASRVADNRDAVVRVSLEVGFRPVKVKGNRPVAAVTEAHVAVRVDEAGQRESPGQVLPRR